MDFPLVFVCAEADFQKLQMNVRQIRECIPAKDFILIGKHTLSQKAATYGFSFIDEDTLLPGLTYKNIEQIIMALGGDAKRTGWYFQQFLKMGYAIRCDKPFYLIWDADTIPLHAYNSQEIPFFDVKSEYHQAYFDTMQKLFPELRKNNSYSFISEHMLIQTDIMKEIISRIEGDTRGGGGITTLSFPTFAHRT